MSWTGIQLAEFASRCRANAWFCLLICISMLACRNLKTGTVSERGKIASSVIESTDTKMIARYDPNSVYDTVLYGPNGVLAGSSVIIPSGALAIQTDIILEQSVSLGNSSVVSTLGLDTAIGVTPVGAGMIVRPAEQVTLSGQLVISLPLDGSPALRGGSDALGLDNGKNYAVFYKQFIQGSLKAGVIPSGELKLTDDRKVTFSGSFGVYWLAETSVPIESRIEVASEEPIVNVDNVAVIESAEIVAETVVKEKASQPEVQWNPPSLSFDGATRSVSLKATTIYRSTLSDCQADFFQSNTDVGGIVVDSGTKAEATLAILKPEPHVLVGRFRCRDDFGRLTMSPWSSQVDIPLLLSFGVKDFFAIQTQVQTRYVVKLVVSPFLTDHFSEYTIRNASISSDLFSSTLTDAQALEAFVRREYPGDGSTLLRITMSPAGIFGGFAPGENRLVIRSKLGTDIDELKLTIKDFPAYDNSALSSFSSHRSQDNNGFRAWGNVLSNPVVRDKSTGQTVLTHGVLNMINP